MSESVKEDSEKNNKTHYTKDNFPTSFKCEPINLTLEEIEEKTKNAKVFIPYGGMGNLEGAEPFKLNS